MKTRTQAIFLVIVIAFSGCGDDQVENPTTGPIVVDPAGPGAAGAESNSESSGLPQIALEELDQAQERYDEQMVTSFGVGERGWQTYKASKSGYLTRFTFYGCAHSKNKIYGESMSGVIRQISTNKVLGTWTLTRDDVVTQLLTHGLRPTDYDWIDVRISDDQRIPQVAGETYSIQTTTISQNRNWFGSFRFANGDRYPDGAWWHAMKPPAREADLVFRTYVGKTNAQVTAERALRHEELKERQRQREEQQVDNTPKPIIPPGEFVPLPPADPVPLPAPVPQPEQVSPVPVKRTVEQNATKKPLLPFLRPQN